MSSHLPAATTKLRKNSSVSVNPGRGHGPPDESGVTKRSWSLKKKSDYELTLAYNKCIKLEILIRCEVLPTYHWRTLPLKNRTLEFQPPVFSVLDYEECIFSGSEAQQTDIISTRWLSTTARLILIRKLATVWEMKQSIFCFQTPRVML